jgi:cysteine rich repeat protein
MLRKSLILAFLLASVPALSFAQGDDPRARGDRACKSDASRLCRKVIEQGEGAVLACLQENERRLGRSCRRFLEEQGQL